MTKGKKQEGLNHELVGSGEQVALCGSPAVVGTEELLSTGMLRRDGRDYLLVAPRLNDAAGPDRFQRTPLGALAPTVLSTLGLWDTLVDAVIQHARPRCLACGVLTERMESVDPSIWPQDGYVALVVDGIEETAPLRDQCELLGVERALIAGILVRADEVGDEQGEPVLKVFSASQQDECEREIILWFAKGSKAFRLVHFASREARGVDLQWVRNDWRCPSCERSYPVVTREGLQDAESCGRCRGQGWISVEGGRHVACQDCDAFASESSLAAYEFDGVPLKRVATRSLGAILSSLRGAMDDQSFQAHYKPLFQVSDWGLASYPIGMPVSLLSRGERAMVTVISARLSQLSEMTLVIDCGSLCADSKVLRALAEQGDSPSLSVIPESACVASLTRQQAVSAELITLRDIHRGPLEQASLEIPRGGLTAIIGEIGVGKTLLLREMSHRFAKRKKLQHVTSFGSIKKCHLIEAKDDTRRCVLDAVGIGALLAGELARTRHARERGVSEDDLTWRSSKHFCTDCLDVDESTECEVCGGALVDDRIGSLAINGVPFATLMTLPLADVAKILWAHDEVVGLIARLPEGVRSRVSLSTRMKSVAPAMWRFLEVFAPLARIASRGPLAGNDLILVDRPFATSALWQSLIVDVIHELQGKGATVVCAGVPKGLEDLFEFVVRLQTVGEDDPCGMLSEFFDARLARRVVISVTGTARSE